MLPSSNKGISQKACNSKCRSNRLFHLPKVSSFQDKHIKKTFFSSINNPISINMISSKQLKRLNQRPGGTADLNHAISTMQSLIIGSHH